MQRTWLIAGLLWAYGILHLIGFLTSWNLISIDIFSRTPTVLPDELPIGVLRDLGALWLLGAVTFWISGYAVVQGKHWWKGLTFGSAILSAIATIVWIHEAWPGLVLNLIIIGLIIGTWRDGHHRSTSSPQPG